MAGKISTEQPPAGTDEDLSEWLSRLATRVNNIFDKVDDYEVLYIEPNKLFLGMTRYFGAAIPGTGIMWEGIWAYTSNGWEQNVKDFLIEVNKGKVPGHSLVHKFGWTNQANTNHNHIWNNPVADLDLVWAAVSETFDIVSADANDTIAGTGARTVFIEFLDDNFITQIEEFNTNGTTIVTTTGFSGRRLQRAWIGDTGTYGGTNIGTITITGTDSGENYAFLEPLEAQTQNTQYTVPAEKTGFILNASMTVESNKLATFHMHYRNDADVIVAPFASPRILHEWDGLGQGLSEKFEANHRMSSKTDIWCDGQMSTGSGGILQFDYDILLIENEYLV